MKIGSSQQRQRADSFGLHNRQVDPSSSNISDTNKFSLTFTGLNRKLSKHFYKDYRQIKNEVLKNIQSNGIVGNLPKEWIEKIPKDYRAPIIKELYFDIKLSIYSFKNKYWKSQTERDLTAAFKKAGVIDKNKHIALKFIDSGTDGRVYRLQGVPGSNFVIKIFQPEFSQLYKEEHASYLEINSAAFWQKKAGKKTQMVPFYFGDADVGYMVNKFISNKAKLPEKYVYPEIYGLKSQDVDAIDVVDGHNKIRGYQVDWGCIESFDDDLNKNKGNQKKMRQFFQVKGDSRYELFEKLRASDSIFNFYIANCINVLPKKEQARYFDALLGANDSEVNVVLANHIGIFKGGERLKYFYKLLENSDLEVKKVLATKFHCVETKDDISKVFATLADGADNELKSLLIPRLHRLSDEDKVYWFKKLAEGADDKNKELLEKFNICLPVDKREECHAFIDF